MRCKTPYRLVNARGRTVACVREPAALDGLDGAASGWTAEQRAWLDQKVVAYVERATFAEPWPKTAHEVAQEIPWFDAPQPHHMAIFTAWYPAVRRALERAVEAGKLHRMLGTGLRGREVAAYVHRRWRTDPPTD